MDHVIAGYTYGAVPQSPVSLTDLRALESSVLWGDEDRVALLKAAEILEPQVEDVLDVWYGFVGANPHLLGFFSTPSGQPIEHYLSAVRARFGRWILDTCRRERDADWLAYQDEIGRRHSSAKKNVTDGADSVPHISLRHLIALIYPITATMRPFLEKGSADEAEAEAMFQAWFKSVVIQTALWARGYGDGAEW